MALGPNPLIERERRTDTSGSQVLTGMDSVDWISIQCTNYGDASDDAPVYVELQGSMDNVNWATIGAAGGVNPGGITVDFPRGVVGGPFGIHDLPPYVRLYWLSEGAPGSESEFEVRLYGGRSR